MTAAQNDVDFVANLLAQSRTGYAHGACVRFLGSRSLAPIEDQVAEFARLHADLGVTHRGDVAGMQEWIEAALRGDLAGDDCVPESVSDRLAELARSIRTYVEAE